MKNHKTIKFVMVVLLCIVLLGALIILFYSAHQADLSNNYNNSTPSVITYEVVSVQCYIQNETNGYGAITDSYKAYAFTYSDGNNLHEIVDFENLEYGLTKVKLGDKNEYVVGYGENKTLYLTKETLSNIQTKGVLT